MGKNDENEDAYQQLMQSFILEEQRSGSEETHTRSSLMPVASKKRKKKKKQTIKPTAKKKKTNNNVNDYRDITSCFTMEQRSDTSSLIDNFEVASESSDNGIPNNVNRTDIDEMYEIEMDGNGEMMGMESTNDDHFHNDISPDIAEVTRLFGPPDPQEVCVGCTRGKLGQGASSYEAWNELIKLFKESYMNCKWMTLAMQMKDYYDQYIKGPANKHLSPREEPLPEWSVSSIFYHFYEHLNEPGIVYVKYLRQAKMYADGIWKHHMWEKDMNSSMRRPRLPREKGDPNTFAMWKDAVAFTLSIYGKQPQKSFVYSGSWEINMDNNRSFINSKRNLYAKAVPTEVYKNKTKTSKNLLI